MQVRFNFTDDQIKAELLRRKSSLKGTGGISDISQSLLLGEIENIKNKNRNKHRLPVIKGREKFPSEMSSSNPININKQVPGHTIATDVFDTI